MLNCALLCAACRLARGEELLKVKDDETLDLREQLSRLRDDFDELRGQCAALTAQGNSKEQQREMGVSVGTPAALVKNVQTAGAAFACGRQTAVAVQHAAALATGSSMPT